MTHPLLSNGLLCGALNWIDVWLCAASAVQLTTFSLQLPGTGLRLVLEGTRTGSASAHSHGPFNSPYSAMSQVTLDVIGDGFWSELRRSVCDSWSQKMALKVFQKALPIKVWNLTLSLCLCDVV